MKKVGIIGAGTEGTALAKKLSEKGYPIAAVASRSFSSAERLAGFVHGAKAVPGPQQVADECDTVFVTTPDGAIPVVVSALAWRAGQEVLHCSGADSLQPLEPARKSGAHVGAFHPLQTFAGVQQALDNLAGSTFAIEAEEPLLSRLKQMAEDLAGRWVVLKSEDRVLYHAAAVMACNYVVTLVKLATDLWATFGVSQSDATRALLPLLKGTLNNVGSVGLPNCLTGPIARGDDGTIRKHLDAIAKTAPQLLSTYRELGRQTIPISISKGKVDGEAVEKMKRLLSQT